ncbi:MAG TPA: hypothetical protein VFB80_02185 [Pirellulaceae bacterium]|nr:hypothetical protein [Pirellulaceae bacterium]
MKSTKQKPTRARRKPQPRDKEIVFSCSPYEAALSDMPLNAIQNVQVNHIVRAVACRGGPCR